MTVVSDIAHILLLVAVLAWAGARLSGGSRRGGLLGFALGAILSVLPGEWNPAFHTRALIGDPSALGWVFLVHLLLRSVWGKSLLSEGEDRALAWPAVIGAALIYPASFGVPGAPDFYNADFGGFALPGAALLLAGLYLWRGFPVAAAGIAFGLLLYGLRFHESANLWDSLIDFPAVVVSVAILVRWAAGLHRRLRRGVDDASLGEP